MLGFRVAFNYVQRHYRRIIRHLHTADEAPAAHRWFELEYARTQVIILRRLPPAPAKVLDVGGAASSIGGACSLPITFVPFSAIWPASDGVCVDVSVPCRRFVLCALSPHFSPATISRNAHAGSTLSAHPFRRYRSEECLYGGRVCG